MMITVSKARNYWGKNIKLEKWFGTFCMCSVYWNIKYFLVEDKEDGTGDRDRATRGGAEQGDWQYKQG